MARDTPAPIIIASDGSARLDPLGVEFHAAALPAASHEQLDHLLVDEAAAGHRRVRCRPVVAAYLIGRSGDIVRIPTAGHDARYTRSGAARREAEAVPLSAQTRPCPFA